MVDFGTDLDCLDDLTDEMSEVSGRMCAVQAWARRLVSPRASLIDDPNYGYDLTDNLDSDLTEADFKQIQGNVDAELVKDERCLSCSSTVTLIAGKLRVVALCEDAEGPFKLVLEVSNVTVEILEVTS